jgi:UDPglucose 6-dehydrogenase
MLATKISFINDIANLCEIVGADINQVRKGIGADSRIGNRFLYPGVGYGGSCFPKDVQALIKTAKSLDYDLKVLQAVEEVNMNQKTVLFKKIMNHFGGYIKGKTIAIWGLSFKPETDDMREAPSLVLIESLLEKGAIVAVYDPIAMHEAQRTLGDRVKFCKDMYETLIGADALAVVTEWSEFRLPNFKVMERLMNDKVLFDGRNIFDLEQIVDFGFKYHSIGRRAINV